jgi:hypothetical protein
MFSLWDQYSYFQKATTNPCALLGHQSFFGIVAGALSAFELCFFILCFNSSCRLQATMVIQVQIYQVCVEMVVGLARVENYISLGHNLIGRTFEIKSLAP